MRALRVGGNGRERGGEGKLEGGGGKDEKASTACTKYYEYELMCSD